MWDILQNNWSGCLKNGNGMERKKKSEDCSRSKETLET